MGPSHATQKQQLKNCIHIQYIQSIVFVWSGWCNSVIKIEIQQDFNNAYVHVCGSVSHSFFMSDLCISHHCLSKYPFFLSFSFSRCVNVCSHRACVYLHVYQAKPFTNMFYYSSLCLLKRLMSFHV